MTEILDSEEQHECVTCGHEWARQAPPDADEAPLGVKDSNGNLLSDGDAVTLVKDLKVKGSSTTLKAGTKVKGIRLVDADRHAGHDVDAKVNGMGVMLKAKFLKKA